MSDITLNSTLALPDLVANTKILFAKEVEKYPQVLRTSGLIRNIPIPSNSGNTRTFDELEVETFAKNKKEGTKATKRKTVQGYKKVGTMVRRASEADLTWELANYGKYPELISKIKNMGRTGYARCELDLAHRFGFGFSTSMVDMDGETIDLTGGDGKAFFDAIHPTKGSTKTFSNLLSGNAPFSKAAFKTMLEMRRTNRIDHFGVPLPGKDDTIWTTGDEDTVVQVKEMLRSQASTDDNKNNKVVNVYNGEFKHVVIPNLDTLANGQHDSTKSKYWGVADSKIADLVLGMHKEPYLKTSADGKVYNEDFSTDTMTAGMRTDYMIVLVSAKFAAASKGDNS